MEENKENYIHYFLFLIIPCLGIIFLLIFISLYLSEEQPEYQCIAWEDHNFLELGGSCEQSGGIWVTDPFEGEHSNFICVINSNRYKIPCSDWVKVE